MPSATVNLQERQRAYRMFFSSPAGQLVLDDLARFCRANETSWHADPRIHAALEGRREVWLRIAQHMTLTVDELLALFGGGARTLAGRPIDLEDDE